MYVPETYNTIHTTPELKTDDDENFICVHIYGSRKLFISKVFGLKCLPELSLGELLYFD